MTNSWKVDFYQQDNGKQPALAWFLEQDAKVQAEFAQIFDLLEAKGTDVGRPQIAPVSGKIYEIRVQVDRNEFRILYFAASEQRFIALSGFSKKTRAIPKNEIDIAERRMKDLLDREKAASKAKQQQTAPKPAKKKGKNHGK
jgi:phage-related protein